MAKCSAKTERLNCGCCRDVYLECDIDADIVHEVHGAYLYETGYYGRPEECLIYKVFWKEATLQEKKRVCAKFERQINEADKKIEERK